jgi:hypothetical protein
MAFLSPRRKPAVTHQNTVADAEQFGRSGQISPNNNCTPFGRLRSFPQKLRTVSGAFTNDHLPGG